MYISILWLDIFVLYLFENFKLKWILHQLPEWHILTNSFIKTPCCVMYMLYIYAFPKSHFVCPWLILPLFKFQSRNSTFHFRVHTFPGQQPPIPLWTALHYTLWLQFFFQYAVQSISRFSALMITVYLFCSFSTNRAYVRKKGKNARLREAIQVAFVGIQFCETDPNKKKKQNIR